MGGVGDVVKSVGSAVGKVVSAVGNTVESVGSVVGNVTTRIVNEVGNVVATITESVTGFIDKVKSAVKSVIDSFKRIILEKLLQIKDKLGIIISYINKILTLIEHLHTLIKIYYYTVKGEIHKAILYVLQEVDKKLAQKIKEIITYINEKITEVYRFINDVRRVIYDEISRIDTRLGIFQIVFEDMADALDVKFIRNIGNGIRKFRKDIIGKIRESVEDAERELKNLIYVATDPFMELYKTFLITEREYERFRILFARLMLDSANNEIFSGKRKTLSIAVPIISS